jgi:hypothetical protein
MLSKAQAGMFRVRGVGPDPAVGGGSIDGSLRQPWSAMAPASRRRKVPERFMIAYEDR